MTPWRPPVCASCGGLLVPSAYGGWIHDDDADDDHTPAPPRPTLAERVAQAQNRSDTDPTWRTDYT